MRVAFFGTPLWAVPVLDALRKRHQVVLVVSQPDKPQGRGLRPAPSPVARYAEAEGLPLLRPARLREEAFLEALRQAAPEVAVVAARIVRAATSTTAAAAAGAAVAAVVTVTER